MYIIFDKNAIFNMDNIYSIELGRDEEDTNIYLYSGWGCATVKHSSREQVERNFEQIFTVLKDDASTYKVYLKTGCETIAQLESIGKGLGERMDDVKAKLASPSGFEVLDQLSSMYYGKQMYFEEDGGVIYSRHSCCNLPTLQDAVDEFGKILEGETL